MCVSQIYAQKFISIHQLESEKYKPISDYNQNQFDSLNEFKPFQVEDKSKSQLVKRVFGYHPYWGGSNYLNYQWNLLSDFCHFSYEVDPCNRKPK